MPLQDVGDTFHSSAHAPEITWPAGGFEWSEKLQKRLPIIRGINTDTYRITPRLAAGVLGLEPERTRGEEPEWGEAVTADRLLRPKPWNPGDDLLDPVRQINLLRKDPDDWQRVFYHCFAEDSSSEAVRACVGKHGLSFTIDAVLQCGFPDILPRKGAAELLRRQIASEPEEAYQHCLAQAHGYFGQSWDMDCLLCYLFPEQSAWAALYISDPRTPPNIKGMLSWSILPVATAHEYYAQHGGGVRGLLLQIWLNGEEAFPSIIAALEHRLNHGIEIEDLVDLMIRMKTPALIPELMMRAQHKPIRAALDSLFPTYAAAMLKSAIENPDIPTDRQIGNWLIERVDRAPRETFSLALAHSAPAARERFLAWYRERTVVDEAPVTVLPSVLRAPPWLNEQPSSPLPTLDLVPLTDQEALLVTDEMRHAAATYRPPYGIQTRIGRLNDDPHAIATEALNALLIPSQDHGTVLSGSPWQPVSLKKGKRRDPGWLHYLADQTAATIWNHAPPDEWETFSQSESAFRALIPRLKQSMQPGLIRYASVFPEQGLRLALPFRTRTLAPIAAHALRNIKKARASAESWLNAHADTAFVALIPQAFGKDKKTTENARHALRWLAQNGHEACLRATAARYGTKAEAAVENLLSVDPLRILPKRMPKLPAFFVPPVFRRPVLKTGGALDAVATRHLATMLAISGLHDPYAGLELVRHACTAASLADFAWDVYEAWLGADAPATEGWAFTALGLLGDDETARRLTPQIRTWPGENAHARATTGLDILGAIGTDTALMLLNDIATRASFKRLQKHARERITAIAERRNLSSAELADRLVPTLGLDDTGNVELDLGIRRLYVTFDSTLKPILRDENGMPLKKWPGASADDDPARTSKAEDRFKALKKEVRQIAARQSARLEQAMCTRRRWKTEDFRQFFLEHPLMRHLVWGVYREETFMTAFAIGGDLALSDCQGDAFKLPLDATVGIAHALEIEPEMADDFRRQYVAGKITQPFPQLCRETYVLANEERCAGEVLRFNGKTVATGSLIGLTRRGWEWGKAQKVGSLTRPLSTLQEIELKLLPGIDMIDVSLEPVQRIGAVVLRTRNSWGDEGRGDIGALEPITLSEIMRDIDLLPLLDT